MTVTSWDFQSLENPQCPHFNTCSVNVCPLDDVQRVTVSEDIEKTCKLSKAEIADLKNNNNQKKLTAEQKKKISSLIKAECCNYSSGCCEILDFGTVVRCPQLGSDKLICKWCLEAVLPLDPALNVSLSSQKILAKKQCTYCGKSFTPISGKVRYCSEICAAKAHRKQKTSSMQKARTNIDLCGQ